MDATIASVLHGLTFYAFAGVTVASAVMVISARNPVHSVLFLVLAFFTSAGLFVLLGAEFLAMIMVVVYVGAVAVLFLFVVMMLDINFVEMRQGFQDYLPTGALVGLIMLAEILMVLGTWAASGDAQATAAPIAVDADNVDALGRLLYTRYFHLFQAAGLILLVAMIGAIVLTHRSRSGIRKQSISAQVARRRDEAVALKKVKPGQGI